MKDIFSPIFLISLALLFLFHQFQPLLAVVLVIGLIFFLLTVWFFVNRNYRLCYWFLVITFALLMGGYFLKTKSLYQQTTARHIPEGEYISISGRLSEFPEIRPKSTILIVKTRQLEYERRVVPFQAKIRFKVMGNVDFLNRGDDIELSAKINKNRFNVNFFANPMETYVLMKGYHFSGYCKSRQMVRRLNKASLFWRIIGSWRRSIRGLINRKYLDGEGRLHPRGVFLEAILLGDRGRQNNDQREALLGTGVYHLLAISGAHIGIIAVFVLFFLKICRVSLRSRYLVTGVILLGFLVLSGFRISAQRAVFMALLIFAARSQYRDHNIFNIISFSGVFMLLVHPLQFLDAGFILTYGITAAIIVGRRLFLPWLKLLPAVIQELISANLSAVLVSLPLSLYFFKRFSFTGLVSGLLLLPVTAVATALGVLLIPAILLSPWLANPIFWLLDKVLFLFYWLVNFFHSQLEFTIYRASPPQLLVVLTLVIFSLLGMTFKRQWLKPLLVLTLLVVVVKGMIIPRYFQTNDLQVFFLDVGQGESEVVVFPGGEALLVDGGGTYYSEFQIGRRLVLPFLLQMGIKVKWVAVTHYHPDHVKGVIDIINILKPQELWLSSSANMNSYYQQLHNICHPDIRICRVDSHFYKHIGGCELKVLHPLSYVIHENTHNNHSMVVKVSNRHHAFVLSGDIEEEAEQMVLKRSYDQLKADVLKVPHHGSKTSSTFSFLACVQPKFAIFSHALNNRFNFPHTAVIDRYRRIKARTLTTAVRGGIKMISTASGIRVETSR